MAQQTTNNVSAPDSIQRAGSTHLKYVSAGTGPVYVDARFLVLVTPSGLENLFAEAFDRKADHSSVWTFLRRHSNRARRCRTLRNH